MQSVLRHKDLLVSCDTNRFGITRSLLERGLGTFEIIWKKRGTHGRIVGSRKKEQLEIRSWIWEELDSSAEERVSEAERAFLFYSSSQCLCHCPRIFFCSVWFDPLKSRCLQTVLHRGWFIPGCLFLNLVWKVFRKYWILILKFVCVKNCCS